MSNVPKTVREVLLLPPVVEQSLDDTIGEALEDDAYDENTTWQEKLLDECREWEKRKANVQAILDRIEHLEFENAVLKKRIAELEQPLGTRTST